MRWLLPLLAQSVDWLSAGLRLQLGVDRKWPPDCQDDEIDPVQPRPRIILCLSRQAAPPQ
jgi:hypothetical protein